MATATGPGQVEPRSVPSETNTRRLAWKLYNFDVGGIALKLEHQRWLDENLVPLLAIFGAQVRLHGTTSRSGSAGINQQLSEQRVAAVRNYLLLHGARPAQLIATATGEADAKSADHDDGTEDDRFRAVVVEISFPVTTGPVRFDRRDPANRNDGFDNSEPLQPPWVLVRFERGSRVVRLENGIGLRLVSTAPNVVQVRHPAHVRQPLTWATQSPQFMSLWCAFDGDAEVHAVDSDGRVVARLRVAVRRKLTVRIAFLYVNHRFRRYSTDRKPGNEEKFLMRMNRIYRKQTNIEFVMPPGGASSLPLTDRFGKEINAFKDHYDEWNAIVRHRDPAARITCFFVREIEEDAERTWRRGSDGRRRRRFGPTDSCDGLSELGGHDILIEDDIPEHTGEILAHEAGHCLRVDHDHPIVSTRAMLMFATSPSGTFIPRAQALRMRTFV